MMTFFTLMKGFVGTAVLYLPREVFLGGWLTSLVSLTLSLMLSFYCTTSF
jgi:amino acid permease